MKTAPKPPAKTTDTPRKGGLTVIDAPAEQPPATGGNTTHEEDQEDTHNG